MEQQSWTSLQWDVGVVLRCKPKRAAAISIQLLYQVPAARGRVKKREPVSSVFSKHLAAVPLYKSHLWLFVTLSPLPWPGPQKASPKQAVNGTWRHTKLLCWYFRLRLILTASCHRDRSPYQESDCPNLELHRSKSGACISLEIQSMAFRRSPGVGTYKRGHSPIPLSDFELVLSG